MARGLCLWIDRLCDGAGILSAVYIAALALLSLAEIVSRNLFSLSIPFAVEYAGYLVMLSLTTGLGWAMKEGAHIRVSLVRNHLPQSLGKPIDVAVAVLGLLVSGFFAFAVLRFGLTTLDRGTVSYFPSQTPLAIPQLLLSIGPITLALACLAQLIRLHDGR
ncbi:MAG: TRAP transporter small permease subunit [Sphingomonadales bacterium]